MPTIRLGNIIYRLPFTHLFREHTPAERERIVESIREHGIQVRVLTYDSPVHGRRCVIDGATRLAIAVELSLAAVPVQHRGQLTDDEAEELARSLNRDRRHLTLEEQQHARRERIKRTAAARAAGQSLRAIAEQENVSLGQVQRDLEESGVSGDTPELIQGSDGKSYPSQRTQKTEDRSDFTAEGTEKDREEKTEEREQKSESGRKKEHLNSLSFSVPSAPSAVKSLSDPEQLLDTARASLATLRQSLDELAWSAFAPALVRWLSKHGAPDLAPLDAALSDLAAEMVANGAAQ